MLSDSGLFRPGVPRQELAHRDDLSPDHVDCSVLLNNLNHTFGSQFLHRSRAQSSFSLILSTLRLTFPFPFPSNTYLASATASALIYSFSSGLFRETSVTHRIVVCKGNDQSNVRQYNPNAEPSQEGIFAISVNARRGRSRHCRVSVWWWCAC